MSNTDKAVGRQDETATALLAGTAIGDPKKNPHPLGENYAIIPPGHSLEYIKTPVLPPRRTGTIIINDKASFIEYWTRQFGDASAVYGSMDPAQFLAVFNDFTRRESEQELDGNWRDHRALFTLQHSDQWNAWHSNNRSDFQGNVDFAYFLEDNLADVITPAPAKLLEIALSMKAKSNQSLSSKADLNNGAITLEYVNVIEGSAQSASGGKVSIPEEFTISIPVFRGLDEKKYQIKARFRYRVQGPSLKVRYELIRPELVFEQAFKDMLADIEKAIGSKKVLFGLPEMLS